MLQRQHGRGHRIIKRRVAGLICLLSLALSAGIVALWVRSYSNGDSLQKWTLDRDARVARQTEIGSGGASLYYGQVDVKHLDPDHEFAEVAYPAERYSGRWRYTTAPGRLNFGTPQNVLQWLGFRFWVWQSWRDGLRTDYSSVRKHFPDQAAFDEFVRRRHSADALTQRSHISVRVPHWFVAGLFAIGPAVWVVRRLRRFRRERRVSRGLCPACGYDLRASTGTCPECGRKVERETNAGLERGAGAA